MKLLSVGSLPPEWGGPVRGGVATFHATLLEGLAKYAADVEVVGVMPPGPLDRDIPFPVYVRPDDVGVAAFYEGLLTQLNPDVVLMNHVAHTVGVTHARLDSSPPAVGIVHSWHSITFGEAGEIARRREVTEEALAGLAALIVGSRHCLREGRSLELGYPATADAIHYPLQPVYSDPGIDVHGSDRKGVLFLGSLIPRKNPASLVEAGAQLPDLDLALEGEGELERSLRELIVRRGIGDRVRIAGHFPTAEHLGRVRDHLLGAQVMCLPSRSESFGLVHIEALACGTPVVGFGPTVREIRDAMGIEIGEPLESGAPPEIAAAIERVVNSTWDRDLLRRATIDTFGLPRVVERHVELLHRVVAGRTSPTV